MDEALPLRGLQGLRELHHAWHRGRLDEPSLVKERYRARCDAQGFHRVVEDEQVHTQLGDNLEIVREKIALGFQRRQHDRADVGNDRNIQHDVVQHRCIAAREIFHREKDALRTTQWDHRQQTLLDGQPHVGPGHLELVLAAPPGVEVELHPGVEGVDEAAEHTAEEHDGDFVGLLLILQTLEDHPHEERRRLVGPDNAWLRRRPWL
mmetsp:Transcript_151748/g.486861  ORF Transcript_151748/g.486861 Transcript_151748/m.486861 type:complete len:207 (+) Transcript_151748:1337-1957(+)